MIDELDVELLDTMQAAAQRRGRTREVEMLADAIDELSLNRIASAICPESALPPRELVAHAYRIALNVAAAKAKARK